MRVGMVLRNMGPQSTRETVLACARAADAAPAIADVWVTDHIIVPRTIDLIYRDNMLEPVALLSHLAALVPRVKLGTSVLILPYRNPVVLAKMLATIDQLSGGRLIVGVGGGWLTEEFAALGASFPERGKVSDECLRVMREMWTHETLSFSGQYWSLQDMQVSPLPAQRHLPVWVGGVSARARRRTAEFGDGWHATATNRDAFQQSADTLRRFWKDAGRDGEPALSLRIPIVIEGVHQAAVDMALIRGRHVITGTVAKIAEDLRGFRALGCGHIALEVSYSTYPAIHDTIDIIAERLRPQVVD